MAKSVNPIECILEKPGPTAETELGVLVLTHSLMSQAQSISISMFKITPLLLCFCAGRAFPEPFKASETSLSKIDLAKGYQMSNFHTSLKNQSGSLMNCPCFEHISEPCAFVVQHGVNGF